MKLVHFLAAISLAFGSAAASAHGNKVHIRGVVEKIGADSLMVKSPDGKIVEVKLLPATMFIQRAGGQDKPAKLSDLTAGNYVVIHASPKDNSLEADEVKFSAPSTVKPPASSAPKPKP